MEFYNPIKDMSEIIGKWEGEIELDKEKLQSIIEFSYHGLDIIQYKQTSKTDQANKIIETGYFFYNKLKEELRHIVINEEGYIENNTILLTKKTKFLKLKSAFDFGYNLPPNIKIQRYFTLELEGKKLEYSLIMGKEAKLISKASYYKKSI